MSTAPRVSTRPSIEGREHLLAEDATYTLEVAANRVRRAVRESADLALEPFQLENIENDLRAMQRVIDTLRAARTLEQEAAR